MPDTGIDYVADYYQRSLGLTPEQARGAAYYMWRNESKLDPGAVNPKSGALGIGQWLGPRKTALTGQYGAAPSIDQQLQFSVAELRGPEKAALTRLKAAKTEGEAYAAWGQGYERPGAAALAKAGAKPEGYYQGAGEEKPALHLNVKPPSEPDALLKLILASKFGEITSPDAPEKPPNSPSDLLKLILAEPQAQPEAAAQQPQPSRPVPSPEGPQPGPIEPPQTVPLMPVPNAVATGPQPISAPPVAPQPIQPPTASPQRTLGPSSAADLLRMIVGSVNPMGQAQAAERREPIIPPTPGDIAGAGGTVSRSPLPPSSIGVQRPSPDTAVQPQLPPRPPGGASGMQQQVEQMVAPGGGLPLPSGPTPAGGNQPPERLERIDSLTVDRLAAERGEHAAGSPSRSFSEIASGTGGGGAGGQPPAPPSGAATPPPGKPPGKINAALGKFRETINEAVRDAQIKAVPMAAGEPVGQAIAKDFANLGERLPRWRRSRWDQALLKFPAKVRAAMWEAMDSASVAAQTNGYNAGLRYITALPKAQREIVMEMDNHGIELWERGREAGLVAESAERLPFYVPRAIVDLTMTPGEIGSPRSGGMRSLDQPGVNLRTRGLDHRFHLTAEQTEAGARANVSENAEIVRDIRVLPLMYERFERAIAGRRMINELKAVGLATGKPTVIEGSAQPGYFTLPHPAFHSYRPRMTKGEGGETIPLTDERGHIVFDRVPLYVSKQFEGPLRAVLRQEDGMLYRGVMAAKSGAMSLIMNSPLIHNAVIWGKALPAMPGKMLTFHYYRQGEALLNDRALMEQAIGDGMAPIGQHGYLQDVHGIAEEPNMRPGRSLTAKAIGGVTELAAGRKAGDYARAKTDQAGEFWHYKLLWKQVAKVQIGLYKDFREHLIKKGFGADAAGKAAAHFANRYAGILPNEAMSQGARKLLNFLLFSRSFTMGNLGIMKDITNGLPQDVRAQMGRNLNALEKKTMRNMAMRKAAGIVMTDIALFYLTNAVIESGLSLLRGDKSLDQEAQGYVDRLHKLMNRAKESPLELLNPFEDMLTLSPLSEHEPSKQDRILLGYEADGTALYGRSPIGKIGEEFQGWLTTPLQLFRNKEGTLARPILNTLANDKGFGQAVYDKTAHGIGGSAKIMGEIAYEFLRNNIPEIQVKAAIEAMQGHGNVLTAGQIAAPAAGFTVSKGAPGGPAVGELYAAKAEARERWKNALPEVKRMVEDGKGEEARQRLVDLNMPPGLVKYYMQIFRNPGRRLSPKALRDFNRYAPPEAIERMGRDRETHSGAP